MAHNAEPMDIDDESVFDNKENTYQHSNVLPRSPCTEKGYEELDVSELNMKLRYSITPSASPMSKSMSHCLDNRQNTITDESLNNTVINEYENNLTRSLNSTLNKTEVKSSKVLPLQALPMVIVDNNRSSVLRRLDTASENNITITVSNENEIDNLSFGSSSSSMAHTPEATTPTKEIPKHDGGSPIIRGLKSVLSMFRSSQSPIPPGDENPKTAHHAVSPADVPLPQSKPSAVASTPKNENNKERSVSRRNSPRKESIVFNEDLEKELQWNDDSTIVFSTEKIPIHKLFFQDKASKSALLNENVQHEDANSTVEYMDVSYNDLSIKDKTLNGTININKNSVFAESDGEFVDCETTITQNDAQCKPEEPDAAKTRNSQISTIPEKNMENITTVNEPFTLDTTKDINNSIDASHTAVEGNLGKQLDFSTADIVKQLSDLINNPEINTNNVISVENKGTANLEKGESSTLSDVQTLNNIQPELLYNQVTSPVVSPTEYLVAATEMVSVKNDDLIHISGIACDSIVGHIESTEPKINLVPFEANAVTTDEVGSLISLPDGTKTTKVPEEIRDNAIGYLSPVDIPLPNDDDIIEINDNLLVNEMCADLQENVMLNSSTSRNVVMVAIDKSITETTHEIQHKVNTYPLSLLPSDVPLHNTDAVDPNNIPHEAIAVVYDSVELPGNEKSVALAPVITTNVDLINDAVNKSTTEVPSPHLATPLVQSEVENIKADIPWPPSPSDIPLPGMDDDNPTKADDLAVDSVTVVANSVQQCAIEISEANPVEVDTSKVNSDINKATEMVSHEVKTVDDTLPMNFNKPKEEEMEISFVETTNDRHFESVAIDLSMVDANIKFRDTLEICQKHTQSFKIRPEIPVVISHNIEGVSTDVINGEQNSANFEMTSEIIDGAINTNIISDPVSAIEKAENFTGTPESSDSLDENVNALVGSTMSEAKPSNNPSVSDYSQEPNVADGNKEAEICKGSNINHLLKSSLLNEQDSSILPVLSVADKKETCDVKDNTALPDLPKDPDVTNKLGISGKVERTPEYEENKMDEEIVLSESNSPFVSMSAEEEFDSESKKEDFGKIENPFSTNAKVAQSPPISPKIVSKGYNLNFDDIDNMDPFATKTKIRMSPTRDASPNTSLVAEDVNKTEIVESLNNNKNYNRRKSMPERKKPLKAKRHLNCTDGTEKVSSKTATSAINDLKHTPKTKVQQEQSLLSQPVLNKGYINNVASVTQGDHNDKLGIIGPSEITPYEERVNKESEAMHGGGDAKEDKSITTENEINNAQNHETKLVEDVMSASSSEQSTYFSAGASSTELTNSRNVFNLPELDDFNPLATKSNIRQTLPSDLYTDNPFAIKSKIKSSPESSLVVTQKGFNSTVAIDNDSESKEATHNLSTCSGLQTSEETDVTVNEVHTEDEDTLEGPFLEADDGNDGDKIPEFTGDKVDVVDFDNLNQPDNDEAGEMFIDAEAFEFLMTQNKTDKVGYSGKESLFLKFDPLFARKVTSEGVAAALNEIKQKQNTPKKTGKQAPSKEEEFLTFEKPVAGSSNLNLTSKSQNVVEERSDDLNITKSKPMMAVTPAVNLVVMTPRKSLTPSRSNRLSMTVTSPAMTAIDRLLSFSGNSSSAGLDATVTYVDRSHVEAHQALTQLRELLAEKERNVYNLRCESKELKDRLSTLETQMKALEAESAERLNKVNKLTEDLAEKTKMNRKMAAVVEEFERTITCLISKTEQDKKRFAEERNQLVRDRDDQTAHLSSMEACFNDIHRKYEKSKHVIMVYKSNEDTYKKSIQEFHDNLAKMHTNYELLKQHATSKLDHANQELEKINKAHEAEVLKFNTMLKCKEVHISSLEESLTQKTKVNEELTAICDELLNKVG